MATAHISSFLFRSFALCFLLFFFFCNFLIKINDRFSFPFNSFHISTLIFSILFHFCWWCGKVFSSVLFCFLFSFYADADASTIFLYLLFGWNHLWNSLLESKLKGSRWKFVCEEGVLWPRSEAENVFDVSFHLD